MSAISRCAGIEHVNARTSIHCTWNWCWQLAVNFASPALTGSRQIAQLSTPVAVSVACGGDDGESEAATLHSHCVYCSAWAPMRALKVLRARLSPRLFVKTRAGLDGQLQMRHQTMAAQSTSSMRHRFESEMQSLRWACTTLLNALLRFRFRNPNGPDRFQHSKTT